MAEKGFPSMVLLVPAVVGCVWSAVSWRKMVTKSVDHSRFLMATMVGMESHLAGEKELALVIITKGELQGKRR